MSVSQQQPSELDRIGGVEQARSATETGLHRAVSLNAEAIDHLLRQDYNAAVASLTSALSQITNEVMVATQTFTVNEPSNDDPLSTPLRVAAAFRYHHDEGTDSAAMDSSCVSYFEKPFLVEWRTISEQELPVPLTDELAAYCSAACFYNMGLALYAKYKQGPLNTGCLKRAHDSFLRAFELLSVLKIQADDPTLMLLLAICNNLAAIQGDLGNILLLQYWGEKFQVVFNFADEQSHWNDSNFHSFRLKKLLHAFDFVAAGSA